MKTEGEISLLKVENFNFSHGLQLTVQKDQGKKLKIIDG